MSDKVKQAIDSCDIKVITKIRGEEKKCITRRVNRLHTKGQTELKISAEIQPKAEIRFRLGRNRTPIHKFRFRLGRNRNLITNFGLNRIFRPKL